MEVVKEEYKDADGNLLNRGDLILLTLVGLGQGNGEIVENEDNELCLFERSQGTYPLKYAVKRDDIIIRKIHV
tara:strand:- start:140 stop:358 length:219 start_codon:yes stop_codon:yes gene_type:complete